MSIFRETFPKFIRDELKRRQDGMAARNPAFLQQLNTRNAWVRMTSGVNTLNASGNAYNNNLASNYVLQGGTLLNNTSLRTGLGGNGTSTYDTSSPGGVKHRLGIRPMPGITNVSIQSKGAYGSLQEATVSFNCWDIKQLEDLELLYMRPGYTVLLEFGWNFAKDVNGTLPKYDILNKSEVSLNKAFAEIYDKIEQSKGTYDALLGYVKNYNWVARDDGGYDCTTTIISLGEVLESLKCNWVPIETTAFSDTGLLNINAPQFSPLIKNSYELGIIPGLLHEMWGYLRTTAHATGNFSAELIDPKKGTKYQLCMSETMQGPAGFNRGGLPKPLGDVEGGIEGWITLGSFCDLLNNYVLIKDQNNNPLTQITTYETDTRGNRIGDSSLKCIASPLSLSTNLGICLVRNDNWASLELKNSKDEEVADKNTTAPLTQGAPAYISTAVNNKRINSDVFKNKISGEITDILLADRFLPVIKRSFKYNGDLGEDLKQLAIDISKGVTNIIVKDNDFIAVLENGNTFSINPEANQVTPVDVVEKKDLTTINFLYYFNLKDGNGDPFFDQNKQINDIYNTLFRGFYTFTVPTLYEVLFKTLEAATNDPFADDEDKIVKDNTGKSWTKTQVLSQLKLYLSNFSISLNPTLFSSLTSTAPALAQNVAAEAVDTLITKNTLQFLVPGTPLKNKTLGNISNIYVNINYLFSQAISKNVASSDNQNTNNISIREYLQGILRDIQNSLGNINQFDIQVDERNSIGRIIDLNFTGDPNQKLFTLQIHNTNSVVRKYGFQSKIFPEMGSIIAISAQDSSGIGKLGYDNATLIAWNEGLKDRLIPKKTFTSDILLSDGGDPLAVFILPFLSKLFNYFEAIKGQNRANTNFVFGGLDFAYRDFLANLSRFDRRNDFKTIIPTELNITLDGIGGMVIGNLFKINQDIVPKGYRNVPGRSLAYIVTKLGHSISDNDWVTDLGAYPVVFENITGTNVVNKWNDQKYPNSTEIAVAGEKIATIPRASNSTSGASTSGARGTGFIQGAYSTFKDNNPYNIVSNKRSSQFRGVLGYKIAPSGLNFLVFDSESNGVRAGLKNLTNYFTIYNLKTIRSIINRYAPPNSPGQTAKATASYINFVTNYLQTNVDSKITADTKFTFKGNKETNSDNIKIFKAINKAILKQEGKLTSGLSEAIDRFDIKNL